MTVRTREKGTKEQEELPNKYNVNLHAKHNSVIVAMVHKDHYSNT